jgi:hypothetical protein
MPLKYKTSSSDSFFLQPDGGTGVVDVVNQFSWTLNPSQSRFDVPTITFTEYQQQAGAIIASILYLGRVIGNAVDDLPSLYTAPANKSDVYKLKYIAEPTGFIYNFPYFNSKKFSRSTGFGADDGSHPFKALLNIGRHQAGFRGRGLFSIGSIFGDLPALIDAGLGVVDNILPGHFGLENPQGWDSTTEGSYEITFDLFNTGTPQAIQDNRNLAYILAYQNSPARRTACIVDPVVIYSVFCPDVVNFPAAYISNLEITNLGNTRQMLLPGDKAYRIIPDAYRFHITFQSLFMPTRNLMLDLDNGTNTNAISNGKGLVTAFNNLVNNQQVSPNTIQQIATALGTTPSNVQQTINTIRANSGSTFVGPPAPAPNP